MKLLLRILAASTVVLLLLGIALGLLVDSIAKQAIERGGTQALGVPTRLEDASIGLLSGRFALSGLAVENPPGFSQPDFFSMKATELELPLSTLLEPRITIPALTLEGITIDIERNATGTNYGAILDHLGRLGSTSDGSAEEGASDDGGKTFLLQRLVVRDARATVNLLPSAGDVTKLSVALPEIVVQDIASEMSLPELCALVVRTVLDASLRAGSGVLPEDLLQDLQGRMGALEDATRSRLAEELGKAETRIEEHAKRLGPEAEKALDDASKKLEGLLRKKD